MKALASLKKEEGFYFFAEGRRLLQVVLSLSDRPVRPVNASYFFN